MNSEEKISLPKIRIITIISLFLFFIVILFLFRWQIVEAKKFDKMATERIRNVTISSLRGSIYSSDGSTLAFEERRFDLYVYLPELERAEKYNKQTRQEFISKVSNKLGITEDELKKSFDSGPLWIKIASKLDYEKKESIINLKRDNSDRVLEGIFVEYTSQRVYPENSLASQVVGFYADNGSGDLEGRAGIELAWEGSLKPIEGYKLEQVDSFENTIPILDFKPIEEQRGTDIYLTIDLQVQKIVEEKLKESVERYGAESGATIIMDPKTGKIIAMANYPTFDPNNIKDVTNAESFNNRGATRAYEFGSVGKIFTVAAAIEENKVEPSTLILPDGHEGCEYFIEKSNSECKISENQCRVCTFDKRAQGPMTVAEGLVKSDNISMYHTADLLGKDLFFEYLEKFRMGKKTGIEIYETDGIIKNSNQWTIADLVTHSYGHGYEATLLQQTSAVSAIANDGVIMAPYIVDKIVYANGNEKVSDPEAIAQPVSKETADLVGGILSEVYANNVFEYYNRDLLDYSIGMKSGTALIPFKDKLGYSNNINATYVGFDLSDDKTFIMSTWLENPKQGTLSSQNARTLWIETFRGVKDYLNVPKKNQ